MAHQTFVVTGSASGIGKYVTHELVSRGHAVMATDVNLAGLQQVAQAEGWPTDRVRVRAMDVRDPAAWAATFDEAVSAFGGVDVLMNIAGYLRAGTGHEMSVEDVHRHIDVNLKGVIFGVQAAARHMIPRKRGHIVTVSSMSALAAIPGIAVYSASKFAVRAFCLANAYELRPHGIAHTVVCPDAVETPMTDHIRGQDAAAMVFSSSRLLSVEEVGGELVGRVLAKRPLEVVLPHSRAWIARLGNLFPNLSFAAMPGMLRRGATNLARLRAEDKTRVGGGDGST